MTKFHSRRNALKSTVAAGIALVPLQSALSQDRVIGANERIRLGFIGVANRGSQLIDAFKVHPDADIVALCDVDTKTVEKARERCGGKAAMESDFRRMYDKKDIDAVVIATPDHWHAIQTVEACKAGKDVYVEKPLSVTVVEGRKMVEAARKYRRIVQVGIHRRSSPLYSSLAAKGVDAMVGHITVGRSFRASNMYPTGIGKASPSTPPQELDWDLWLGPRPERPYQTTLAPYKFRWYDLYSSQMGNWGVHYIDAMRWLLEETAPVSVCAMGGRYAVDDDRTVPDTAEALFEFESGRLLSFCQYEACGNPGMATDERYRPLGEIELRGTQGTLYVDCRKYRIKPESAGQFQAKDKQGEEEVVSEDKGPGNEQWITELHARNFLDCVRSRNTPVCDVEAGHRSTTMALLANISLALRQRLDWNGQEERFIGNAEANALLHYEYRTPWKLEV